MSDGIPRKKFSSGVLTKVKVFAMIDCIAPEIIQEGDISAYVEGEAASHVVTHIQQCPACTEKAAQLQQISRNLTRVLYRFDCPASEILGEFHLGRLTGNEKLSIAAHVRFCPHCRDELAMFDQSEHETLLARIRKGLPGVTRLIEAALLPVLNRPEAGVRGGPTQRYAFKADQLDILVSFQATSPGALSGTLLGTVMQVENWAGCSVWLFGEDEIVCDSRIDEQGIFIFEHVALGVYDLIIYMGETAVLLAGVVGNGN